MKKIRTLLLICLMALAVWLYKDCVIPSLSTQSGRANMQCTSLDQEMHSYLKSDDMPYGGEILNYWT